MADPSFAGRRVLLGVSGSIAVVASGHLVTELRRRGADVRVAMTEGAQRFVTPLLFQSLSGNPVATSQWDADAGVSDGMTHLSLAAWAQVLLVAPASAGVLARLAHGLADDVLTATALAVSCPLVLAPAMETAMWTHPATRANVATLRERGAILVGPVAGRLASGREGEGRMADVGQIQDALRSALDA